MFSLFRNYCNAAGGAIIPIILLFNINLTIQQVQILPNPEILHNCLELEGLFCVNSTNYPRDAIHRAIQKNFNLYKQFFDSDDKPSIDSPGDETASRSGDDPSPKQVSMCDVEPKTIYPRIAINENNEKYHVINDDFYKQSIRVTACGKSVDEPCIEVISRNLPNGWKSKCIQRSTKTALLGVKDDSLGFTLKNLEIKATLFDIPSCCECVLLQK